MPFKDPDRAREYSREWQRRNRAEQPEVVRARHNAKRAADPDRYRQHGRRYYRANRDAVNGQSVIQHRDRYARLRIAALTAYGGDDPRCACCGEGYIEFLVLDHEGGGGGEHRRELRAKHLNIWEWCRREGYPTDRGLRVLCHNCNMATAYYPECPHAREEMRRSA